MKLKHMVQSFHHGKMDKKFYWELVRDKLQTLLEIQEVLAENHECSSIHIIKDGIVYESKSGSKIFFDFSEPISRAEGMLASTEREDWEFVYSLINTSDTVLDIGANVGWFSIQLLNRSKDNAIYAVEPVGITYEKMRRNLQLNNALEKVKTFNIGFYDKDGDSKIYVPPALEASSLRPVNDDFYLTGGVVDSDKKITGQREMTCQLMTLDNFVTAQSITNVDFIKCDTEGAEKMVFAGGKDVFTKMQPMVYTEMLRKHAARFSYHPNDIIAMFSDWGYKCFTIVNGRLLEFTLMDEDTKETNFLFLHTVRHGNEIKQYSVED